MGLSARLFARNSEFCQANLRYNLAKSSFSTILHRAIRQGELRAGRADGAGRERIMRNRDLTRRRGANVFLAAALVLPAARVAWATTDTFIGPDTDSVNNIDGGADGYSSDWVNPFNWSEQSIPAPGETVIGYTAAEYPTNTPPALTFDLPYTESAAPSGFSATVDSFTTNSQFDIYGGTLSGDQPNSASPISITGAGNGITVYGGELTNLTVNSSIGFQANSLGVSNVVFNGPVNLIPGDGFTLDGANALNGGLTLTSNQLTFTDNSSLTIGAAGVLDGYGYIGYNSNNGGTSLVNNGTLSADVPGATLNVYAPSTIASFTNNGTASAIGTGAVLSINTPLDGTGTFTASGGGTIQVNSSWAAGNGVSVHAITGTVNSDSSVSGTFNVAGNNFNITAGDLTNVAINGNVNFPAAGLTLFGANTL